MIEAFHNPLTNANGGGALRSVEPFTGLRIVTTTGAGAVGDPVRPETWILDERGRLIAHDDPHAERGTRSMIDELRAWSRRALSEQSAEILGAKLDRMAADNERVPVLDGKEER